MFHKIENVKSDEWFHSRYKAHSTILKIGMAEQPLLSVRDSYLLQQSYAAQPNPRCPKVSQCIPICPASVSKPDKGGKPSARRSSFSF